MNDILQAIGSHWPARHPDRIQVYSWPTSNGVKIPIALEEMDLPYDLHLVDIGAEETWMPEFLAINPNGKIPAIVDPNGPGRRPLSLFESGAILHYLAERSGQLLPADPAERWQTIQWLTWQVAAVGPTFGQLGWFHKFAGRDVADQRPLQRVAAESRRLLWLMEERLRGGRWMMGESFTIVDVALLGMVRNLVGFYDAGDLVGYHDLRFVPAWLECCLARPAVRRGIAAVEGR